MTTTRHQPTLILWDIDHTLVDIGEVSCELYAKAFAAVTGQPLRELADMTGRTERAILIDTLALHGIADPEGRFDDFYAALAQAADELRARMRTVGRGLPGAGEAIAALAQDGVVQTVVTGNLKPIATTKLDVFELSAHIDFEVGGYGSDGDTRPPLIRLACRRARDKYGWMFESDRMVVIGDTPLDISSAREVGVRAVAVATGSSTVDELNTAKADAVIPDLTDTEAVVRAVLVDALHD